MTDKNQTFHHLLRVLFVIYSLFMLWLLFGRDRYELSVPYLQLLRDNSNLIPFATIRRYARLLTQSSSGNVVRHAVINLAGNVFMFVPFGILLPVLFAKFRPFSLFFLRCLALISLVEFTQLFMLVGSMDIDDVILNMLGFILGYCLYRLSNRHSKHNRIG